MINLYKTGTWNDAENDAQYADGSLCQYDPEPCEQGWVFSEHNNLCYKLVNVHTNWGDAINTCKAAIANPSANLASIPDQRTNSFLARLTYRVISWIGASNNSDGDWAWSDESQWNYTNWGPEEPSTGNNVVINWPGFNSGMWKSVFTEDHLAPALCQYDLNVETTATTTLPPTCAPSTTTTTSTCACPTAHTTGIYK